MPSNPVVRVVPLQPHCFAFGGFEIQMISAMEAVRETGLDISPLDFWRREADYDVLHIWGLDVQHINTAMWANRAGKKVVVTALANYPGFRSRLRHFESLVKGPARLIRELLSSVDALTVVNEGQAEYIAQSFRYPAGKIFVVPNIVDQVFFDTYEEVQIPDLDFKDYVLCSGNVCPRKNQLKLIASCNRLGVPLVLAGNVLTGEEAYGRAVEEAVNAGRQIRWIKGLEPKANQLVQLYRAAAVFALPSFVEQQPISALEAAACRKPLVLANRAYARQTLYKNAVLADPSSTDSIARSIHLALSAPEAHRPSPEVLMQCRKESVGLGYRRVYEE